ncbi:MAG: hypothetical protein E6Q39_00070 [Crocinitomicaceae bacterium]|nr:MAG: hypothetical protein E6Q39_00070 [Crocinitomicaceae bacterium]
MKTITKIKLTDFNGSLDCLSGVTLSYWEKKYDQEGEFSHIEEVNEFTLKNFYVHEDMLNCFIKISKHLAIITDQCDHNHINSDELVTICNQVIIKGEEEKQGIMMTGSRKLKNELILNINSPFFVFAVNNDYEFIENLYSCLSDLIAEAREILNNQKCKLSQLELELN